MVTFEGFEKNREVKVRRHQELKDIRDFKASDAKGEVLRHSSAEKKPLTVRSHRTTTNLASYKRLQTVK